MIHKRLLVAFLVATLTLGQSAPARAYLELGLVVNGRQTTLKWSQMPVRYFVTDRGVPGVSATDLQSAAGRAFATWESVPTASITYTFGGYTSALPGEDDGRSVLGFVERPDLDRVLASTSFLMDVTTGAILESDIFFNASFQWSVSASGQAGYYDVQTIALHEIGHLSGLGHSALGETELTSTGRRVIATDAIMFPIAFPAGTTFNRSLHADDVAGISDLYPDGGIRSASGSISGRVTLDGHGVLGAHIVAFNPSTGAMIGGFSLNSRGEFLVADLPPGPYVVRVEPLDDADTGSFLDGDIEINFRVTYFNRLVIAPRGADSGSIVIAVPPK